MTFSVYRKVFLVFNFDTECLFWTQIGHRMSFRPDISGQYFPDNDISGQPTRNAFRESLEMSFLVKKIIYFFFFKLSNSKICFQGPWLKLRSWVLYGWNLLLGHYIPVLLAEIRHFGPIYI